MGKRQQRTLGAILKVPLGDGTHSYALTMPEADFIVFDSRTSEDLSPEDIITKPQLFRVGVHKYAWSKGRWEKIGKVKIPNHFAEHVPKFIQDRLNPKILEIYLAGDIRKATREECEGLECCAIWDAEHVEDRIRDYYEGRECKWIRSLTIK